MAHRKTTGRSGVPHGEAQTRRHAHLKRTLGGKYQIVEGTGSWILAEPDAFVEVEE